nr:glycosyltransferase [Cellulosimicrobium arenosum]
MVSADGAYGGPLTVARLQSQELARRGHSVHLVAARDTAGALAAQSYRVTLADVAFRLPVGQHSGIVAPGVLAATGRLLRGADVVHVHLARDLVTLPAAVSTLGSRTPLVVQTHGMVKPDPRASASALDTLVMGPVLRRADERLVLTTADAENVRAVAGAPLATRRIPNGVPVASGGARWVPEHEQEVVFCSRLHPRKRPDEFVRLAHEMRGRGYRGRFTVLGPDGGSLGAVRSLRAELAVDDLDIAGAVPPDDVAARLSKAQAFVLPSRDEPYPMALLEAMSLGLPSVISRTTGVSELFERTRAALVTDASAAQMADALLPVLRDERRWAELARRARCQVQETNGMGRVGDVLDEAYRAARDEGVRHRGQH